MNKKVFLFSTSSALLEQCTLFFIPTRFEYLVSEHFDTKGRTFNERGAVEKCVLFQRFLLPCIDKSLVYVQLCFLFFFFFCTICSNPLSVIVWVKTFCFGFVSFSFPCSPKHPSTSCLSLLSTICSLQHLQLLQMFLYILLVVAGAPCG